MGHIKEDLKEILGEDNITDEEYERILYSHDLASLPKLLKILYKTTPDVVVRPKTTEQVAKIVKYARKEKTPITPKGSSTSITGSSMPTRGGIALDMSSMNNIRGLDKNTPTVEVETGIIWGHLEKYLQKNGYTLNTYPSSQPASTVGGWISGSGLGYTIGGIGVGSATYGAIADNVESLQIVLPTGEIKDIPSKKYEVKDFIGTDGTLGIVTKAKIRIRKKPQKIKSAAFSFEKTEDMLNAIDTAAKNVKIYFSEFHDHILQEMKKEAEIPIHTQDNTAYFTLEGTEKEVEKEIGKLQEIIKKNNGEKLDDKAGKDAWNGRFNPIRIKKAGPSIVTSEFIIDTARLNQAYKETEKIAKKYNAKIGVEGAIVKKGITTFTPILLKDERKDINYMLSFSITKDLNDLAVKLEGKPYGVGHFNTFYSKNIHGPQRLEKLKQLKKELDPENLINPEKSIKHTTRLGIAMPKIAYDITMKTFSILYRLGI